MKAFGIEFAPLCVPLERRIQTFVAFSFMLFLITGGIAGWLLWLGIIYYSPLLRYPMLLYGAWILYDRDAGEQGGRRSDWVRSWNCWKHFKNFFPAQLHKTADLPADKNYLLAVFPHGILCSGAFCAFGHNHSDFSELFPGLKPYVLTLVQHFITPFIREFALRIGNLPSSASCITKFLGENYKGNALALMVGGAQEAFYTKPGTYKLYLLNRKGFIKIALKTGASLVPVISFGEPEIYDQIQNKEGSLLKKIQNFYKKMTGIAPVLFVGRGIFQYSFGIVPHRRPLNVVVGKPISVEKINEPTQEDVDKLHVKFIEELRQLFESEKHKYIENAEKTELIIQ